MNQKERIFVKGNIIAESGRHFASEFVAGALIPNDWSGKVIQGDLWLTSKKSIEPFYEYWATEDIVAGGVDDGDICAIGLPSYVIKQFDDDINDIINIVDVELSDMKRQNLFFKMCYLNAVCAYEYFMESFLVSAVLTEEILYKKFLTLFPKNHTPLEVARHIESAFYTTRQKMAASYGALFGIEIPEFSTVEECINIRNELAHRNGHVSLTRGSLHEVFTKKDVLNAINAIRTFVNEMMDEIRESKMGTDIF